MKSVHYLGFALLALVLSSPALADDLYQALQTVYQTNPQILSAREQVKSAEAVVDMAWSGWKPAVGASASIGSASTEILDKTYKTTPIGVGVKLTQNIFQGFATSAQIDAAKYMFQAKQASLSLTEQDVFLSAINAYIGVMNAKEVLTLQQGNKKVLQEYYARYKDMEKLGLLTQTDLMQAQARLEGANYRVIAAKTNYDNAKETFRRIYGKAENKYQDISINSVQTLFPKSLEEAEKLALLAHPAIQAANASYQAANEDITVSQQTLRPSVDIKASGMHYDDLPIVDNVKDARIGVYLTVPLYDKGVAGAQGNKAKFTASAAKEQITQTQRVVAENLRKAWNIYQAQDAAIKSANSRIKANKQALNGIKDEQERGRRTVLDVLDAEQELLDSKVALTQAKHQKVSAFFAVLSGVGRLTAKDLKISKN